MLSIHVLLEQVETRITTKHITREDLPDVEGVLLMGDPQEAESGYVYVGAAATAGEWLTARVPGQPLTCICTADEPLDAAGCGGEGNLIQVDMPLGALMNAVSKAFARYTGWSLRLARLPKTLKGLQDIVAAGSRALECPVAVLDMQGRKLAGSLPEGVAHPVWSALFQNGFLAEDTLEQLSGGAGQIPMRQVYRDGQPVATVLFALPEQPGEAVFLAYFQCLLRAVEEALLSQDALGHLYISEASALIKDLIDLRISEPEELNARLKANPTMLAGKYYHPAVMTFHTQTNTIPWSYISKEIRLIFPGSNVVVYGDHLIIVAPKNKLGAPLQFDRVSLEHLLARFDAYVAIGNHTRFLTSLRPLYLQALITARLGRVFGKGGGERIFHFSDYYLYYIVDLCVDASANIHNCGNLSYLCHPALIGVVRYDEKYGTNLTEVLHTYLSTNCNATLSAKRLYLHRNTMNYKIKQLEGLVGYDLKDPQLQYQLLFSFALLEYQDKYLKEKLPDAQKYGAGRGRAPGPIAGFPNPTDFEGGGEA